MSDKGSSSSKAPETDKPQKIYFDKAVDRQSILQAREQALCYYLKWRYRIPYYFERYQQMEEKERYKIFEGLLAYERFVVRDKGTKEEVRSWTKQMKTHLECLNHLAKQEKEFENDKLMQSIQRRKHLQNALKSWEIAEEQRLEKVRLAQTQTQRKESIISTFTRSIAAFFRRNSDKTTTTNEQQENLIRTYKKV